MAKTEQQNIDEMSKNDILDEISTATAKLKLTTTLVGELINIVEKKSVDTPEQAMIFASRQDVIGDLLHIVLDYICYCTECLNKAEKEGTII